LALPAELRVITIVKNGVTNTVRGAKFR